MLPVLIKIVLLLFLLSIIFLFPLLFSHWLCIYMLSKKTVSDQHRRTILVADIFAALVFFATSFLLILLLSYYPTQITQLQPFATITKPAIWAINKIVGPDATKEAATEKLATMIVFTLVYMLSWLLAIINTMFLMQSFKKQNATHMSFTKAVAINSIALILSFICVPIVFFVISTIMEKMLRY